MTVGWETSSQDLADLARARGFNPAKYVAICTRCGARSDLGVITHEPNCDVKLDNIRFERVRFVERQPT